MTPQLDTLTVYRAMQRDRQIYCIQPYCLQGGRLMPAHQMIRFNGGPWSIACDGCIASWRLANHQEIDVTETDAQMRAEFFAGLARKEAWPEPVPHATPLAAGAPPIRWMPGGRAGLILAALAAVGILSGMMMISHGNALNYNGDVSGPGAPWVFWGWIVIALPFVLMVIYVVNQAFRRTERALHAKVAHLPQAERRAAETAITAGLYGGALLFHHEFQRRYHARQAVLRDQALHGGRDPGR